MVEFALVVPLLLVVVTSVLRVGGWVLDMAEADAAAHTAARAAGRSPDLPLHMSVRRALPVGADVQVSRVVVAGQPAVRVEMFVPPPLPGWGFTGSAVAVETLEPR